MTCGQTQSKTHFNPFLFTCQRLNVLENVGCVPHCAMTNVVYVYQLSELTDKYSYLHLKKLDVMD